MNLFSTGGSTLVVSGSGPNLSIKGLIAGTGITFFDNGTSITIIENVNLYSQAGTSLVFSGSGPNLIIDGLTQGPGISFQTGGGSIAIINTSLNSGVNLFSTGGTTLVVSGSGPNLVIDGLTQGPGISFQTGGGSIAIINTSLNSGVNLFSYGQTSLVYSGSGPNMYLLGLNSGSGININSVYSSLYGSGLLISVDQTANYIWSGTHTFTGTNINLSSTNLSSTGAKVSLNPSLSSNITVTGSGANLTLATTGTSGKILIEPQTRIAYYASSAPAVPVQERYMNTLTITNNTGLNTITTISTNATQALLVQSKITSFQTGGTASLLGTSSGFDLEGMFKNVGGSGITALGPIQTLAFTDSNSSTWNSTYTISGAGGTGPNILVQVQNTNINPGVVQWVAVTDVTYYGSSGLN